MNDDDDGCDDEAGAGCSRDHQGHRDDRHRDEAERHHRDRHQDEDRRPRHQGGRNQDDCHHRDGPLGLARDHHDQAEAGSACQTRSWAVRVEVGSACPRQTVGRWTDQDDAGHPCSYHQPGQKASLQRRAWPRPQVLPAWIRPLALRESPALLLAGVAKGRLNHST